MLEVRKLTAAYNGVTAVDDVSFTLHKGEVLGLVGESGSGKSTVALSIMRLISPPGRIISGEVDYHGQDLLKISEGGMIKIRGAKISMIFQDPFSSLNPVFSVGDQIAEVFELHQGLSRHQAWEKTVEMLELVQIKDPGKRSKDYPHQFSGGMRQRVMIAMALACRPEILIADEPTTALDVTIQAEILRLLKELQEKFNLSIIYITHNFGIVKAICDRVVVMRKGRVVEEGKTAAVIEKPKAEYTKRLIDCLKKLTPCPPLLKREGEGSDDHEYFHPPLFLREGERGGEL